MAEVGDGTELFVAKAHPTSLSDRIWSPGLRVKEVAERLEISPSLVYQLIAAGRLRCTRHGLGRGTVRVSEEQLAQYLAAAEAMPEPRHTLKWIR